MISNLLIFVPVCCLESLLASHPAPSVKVIEALPNFSAAVGQYVFLVPWVHMENHLVQWHPDINASKNRLLGSHSFFYSTCSFFSPVGFGNNWSHSCAWIWHLISGMEEPCAYLWGDGGIRVGYGDGPPWECKGVTRGTLYWATPVLSLFGPFSVLMDLNHQQMELVG